jgi:hypothetical protein
MQTACTAGQKKKKLKVGYNTGIGNNKSKARGNKGA